jgi:hypothetical protein
MISKAESFHRSTPIQRNDGTMPNAERPTERRSVKAIANAVIQRNAVRNDSGTTRNDDAESFRTNSSNSGSFHRSTMYTWNGGTIGAVGPYTPWSAPVSIHLVHELHMLIAEYAKQYRLADDATQRLIETARRQAAASIPESVQWFRQQLASSGDAGQKACSCTPPDRS